MRVYPTLLSLGQVLQLYTAGNSRTMITLGGELLWIPCNSLNVVDQSGNGHNGVLYGPVELVAS